MVGAVDGCHATARLTNYNFTLTEILAAILFPILQFIVIVLEVAVIYICCPRKLLLVKN